MGRTNQKPRRLARGAGDYFHHDFMPLSDMFYERMFVELAKRGFEDVRNGHQAVFINIEDDGSTLTELATRAKISKQAMHELVNDLEARGYVERVPSPKDGRSKLIRTTDKGERHIEAAWACIAEIEREWSSILGVAGMKNFRTALRKLHAHYSANGSAGEKDPSG